MSSPILGINLVKYCVRLSGFNLHIFWRMQSPSSSDSLGGGLKQDLYQYLLGCRLLKAFGVWYYSKITDQAPPFRVKKNQKLTTDKKRPTPNWPLRVKTPAAAVFGDPSARQLSKPKRLALHFPESRFKHKPHMARRSNIFSVNSVRLTEGC
jgi:hypothetical protein